MRLKGKMRQMVIRKLYSCFVSMEHIWWLIKLPISQGISYNLVLNLNEIKPQKKQHMLQLGQCLPVSLCHLPWPRKFILLLILISNNPHRWASQGQSVILGTVVSKRLSVWGLFDIRIRFKNHSLSGQRQQMKARFFWSLQIYNKRQKPLCHIMPGCQ